MQDQRSSLLSLLLLTVLVAPVTAQEPATAPDKPDPAVKEQLDLFDDAIKPREGERDREAMNLIDQLLSAYPKMHPKDQASVVKSMRDCLTSSRIKRAPEHRELFVAAAYALGQMGADGAAALAKAYKSSKFKGQEWIAMRAVFVKSIGKTKDLRQVDFLIERAARDPDDEIMAAAGEALGNYQEADQKVRKDIAKELIKKFGEVHGKANDNLNPGDAQVKRSKQRLTAISHDWNKTLSALTGEAHTTAPDWQHFYNKNKAKDWDKK